MSISSFMMSNYWIFFFIMQSPAFMFLMIDVVCYVIWVHPFLFAKYHVLVYEQREGGSAKVKKCYGKICKDATGQDKVWITKYKKYIPEPEPMHLIPLNNRQDILELVRDKNGSFIPKKIWDNNNLPDIKKVNTTVIRWGQQERKEALERLITKDEHWLKTYFPQIGLMLIFVTAIMAFILVGYYSNMMVERAVNVASGSMSQQLEVSNKYARIFLYAMGEESLPENILLRETPIESNVTGLPKKSGGFMGLMPS